MAEPELGKVVELIMKNPELISEIRELWGKESESADESPAVVAESSEPAAEAKDGQVLQEATETAAPEKAAPQRSDSAREKRNELLRAMKPYVSSERGKAIESMLTIADILDMMRSK